MHHSTQDSAMMVCYRECLSNLEKFTGSDGRRIEKFIKNIERIGKMIDANENVLHCMCTAKLDGEAQKWYENTSPLTEWETFKSALLERFAHNDPSSKIFDKLKDRKQKIDESATSYYDDVIRLCNEYDSTMSQKMMISWLENGLKESLKIQVKRQMKSLQENERTTQSFLKFAKDEEELQDDGKESTLYAPYFTNAISTTTPPIQEPAIRIKRVTADNGDCRNFERTQIARTLNTSPKQNETEIQDSKPKYSDEPKRSYRSALQNFPRFRPCLICQRNNHRTIDCYQKQSNGCFKCGQFDHRVRDCPKVFY